MKRTRDTLTGGTGDVSPQWLVIPVLSNTGTDSFASAQINCPVSRLSTSKGKATVIEILKVLWAMPGYAFPQAEGLTNIQNRAQLSTAPLTQIKLDSPSVFDFNLRKWRQYGTAAEGDNTYFETWSEPDIHDLTDGAGHGVLIATDSIYLGVDSVNYPGIASYNVRILYRYKEVGLQEYIGMVQSQQVAS